MPKKTDYLWQVLIDRGLFVDRKSTSGWILSGKVIVNGEKILQEGTKVPIDAEIHIKGLNQKYVGKGGLKLEKALLDFTVDVTNKVAIDVGASTGGFSDCLLQHNISKIYAVDVGFGQLAGKLRQNPKIVNMERTNISEVRTDQLNPIPSVAVIDVSYLSLKVAVPIVSKLLADDGDIICLVKPLFEVSDNKIRRLGVIDDINIYKDILNDLVNYFSQRHFSVRGITNSPVTGNNGTVEFFIHLNKIPGKSISNIEHQIDDAIKASLEIPKYKY